MFGFIVYFIIGDEEGKVINGMKKVFEVLVEEGECFDYCLVGELINFY